MTLLGGGELAIQMMLSPKARAARRNPALVLIHGEPDGPALAAPSSITGMPGHTPCQVPMTGALLPSGIRLRSVSSISGAGETAAPAKAAACVFCRGSQSTSRQLTGVPETSSMVLVSSQCQRAGTQSAGRER